MVTVTVSRDEDILGGRYSTHHNYQKSLCCVGWGLKKNHPHETRPDAWHCRKYLRAARFVAGEGEAEF